MSECCCVKETKIEFDFRSKLPIVLYHRLTEFILIYTRTQRNETKKKTTETATETGMNVNNFTHERSSRHQYGQYHTNLCSGPKPPFRVQF